MSEEIESLIQPADTDVRKRILLRCFVSEFVHMKYEEYDTPKAFTTTMTKLARKYKFVPNKRDLGIVYREMISQGEVLVNPILRNVLITKSVRSDSGILNVSVSLPPDTFSCKYNCHFCPNEPGMPRSYLSNEDVFKRASNVGFDTVLQVYDRLDVLEENGHPIDKLEFRVLGGTFSCYNHEVTDVFIRDLYYAANTYYDRSRKERYSIEEEQGINVTSAVHVVGLGVETRPDEIDDDEVVRFRRYGVTRVELGVQHTDDRLLRKLNRGHITKHSVRAIRLLKDYGFKVEIHIMADLPGATPEGDKECYEEVLLGEDLLPDYMKDYPCLDVTFTKVKEWKENTDSEGNAIDPSKGTWSPYSERTPDAKDLFDVLVYRQSITPKFVRVNRIQRDFKPADEKHDMLGYTSESIRSNLAQLVKIAAEKQGIYCQCIRCCEIRNEKYELHEVKYMVHKFTASSQTEYYISAEVERPNRNLLLGFIRLRLSSVLSGAECVIPELQGATAMIRELHVYGRVTAVSTENTDVTDATQHLGIGKTLLHKAELIAIDAGYKRMAIISGIGVRDYYRKRGYTLQGTYMIKKLKKIMSAKKLYVFFYILLILKFISYYF
jgi:ELP3 family radical SAM enzyme/protein acetyltransferase